MHHWLINGLDRKKDPADQNTEADMNTFLLNEWTKLDSIEAYFEHLQKSIKWPVSISNRCMRA